MSIRTRVARCLCAVALVGSAGAASAREAGVSRSLEEVGTPDQAPGARAAGLVLDRLSERDLRTWRDIEAVVAATDARGRPRSATLRRLWTWAQASQHVIHVEIVPPSELPDGVVGKFRAEQVDPEGLRHVAVIQLCPGNIRRARVAPSPNGVEGFARFAGLTDEERYAEVLAHELAHAEYFLEDTDLFARLEAAHRARAEFLAGRERSMARLAPDLRERLARAGETLAATEAYAEPVEAAVLRELNGITSAAAARASSR